MITASLFSTDGSTVASSTFRSDLGTTIATDMLAPGLYLVRLTSETGLPLGTQTVVVQR